MRHSMNLCNTENGFLPCVLIISKNSIISKKTIRDRNAIHGWGDILHSFRQTVKPHSLRLKETVEINYIIRPKRHFER